MSILVTGKNGQIAKDIKDYFDLSFNGKRIFYLGREELDLKDKNKVDLFFSKNKIDYILHTSIIGGRRTKTDTFKDFYDNLTIFNNVYSHIDKIKLFVNFDSMASFDRRSNMNNIKEEQIFNSLPFDYYGLSKNLMTRIGLHKKFLNLRIFSCFSVNESNDRMIKGNILKCLSNQDIIINQNKKLDFVYSTDLMRVIEYFLANGMQKYNDYNVCYDEKYCLHKIAKIIKKQTGSNSQILITDKKNGISNTGDSSRINSLPINFIGLEAGIAEMVDKMRRKL